MARAVALVEPADRQEPAGCSTLRDVLLAESRGLAHPLHLGTGRPGHERTSAVPTAQRSVHCLSMMHRTLLAKHMSASQQGATHVLS